MAIKPERTAKVSVLQTLPCHLPTTVFDGDIDVEGIAKPFVDSLNQLRSDVLAAESVWRDVFAMTGTLRTIYSSQSITAAWSETHSARDAQGFTLIPGSGKVIKMDNATGWIQVGFTFTTAVAPAALCHGFLTLMLTEDRQWTIWTIRTILEQLVGCSNVDVLPVVAEHANEIPNGVTNGHSNGINGTQKSSTTQKGSDATDLSLDYDVIIAGGGQAGLCTAGRLQALGVKYVVLETHKRVGENWAVRYDSAKLHTPRNYSQMPFGRIFDSSYQEYLDKHDLVKGYQEFIRRFDIEKNIQFNSTLEGGSWDGDNKIWTLRVNRSGKQQTLICRHVVIAVGSGGQIPLMPSFPGREDFQGEVLHSVDYRSAKTWKGKSAIVVGTANTAHDVASDMVEAGLKTVTMIQRNRTYVLPAEYFQRIAERSYNERARIDDVDREQYSQAVGISRLLSLKALHAMAKKEPERFDALEKAGFKVERYGDIVCVFHDMTPRSVR
jgi:thioredoxin reductase